MKEITKEEFAKQIADFYAWAGSEPKTLSGWFESLQRYATQGFNRAYEKDFPKEKGAPE